MIGLKINGGLPDDLLQWLRLFLVLVGAQDLKSCQPVRVIWFASQFKLDVVTGGDNPIEVFGDQLDYFFSRLRT